MDNNDIKFKIEKFKTGDIRYFEDIYKEYYNKVYFIALNILKNEVDSEDVTQEVFLKVYNSINKLNNIDKFNSWISKIAVSKAIDLMRKNKKVNNIDIYSGYKLESSDNIDDDLIKLERDRLIISLIYNLPYKKRIVLSLFYYSELKVDEIAQVINCPVGTVKSRLNSAKKELKLRLNKLNNDEIQLYGLTLPTLLSSIKLIKFKPKNINELYTNQNYKRVSKYKSYKFKKYLYMLIISSSCIIILNLPTNQFKNIFKLVDSYKNTSQKYILKYMVEDNDGNIAIKKRNVTILKDNPPEIIGADNIKIKKGELFDYSKGVYVKDDNDSVLKTSINGFVDINKVGKYVLEYIAEDTKGNITKKTRIIEVE